MWAFTVVVDIKIGAGMQVWIWHMYISCGNYHRIQSSNHLKKQLSNHLIDYLYTDYLKIEFVSRIKKKDVEVSLILHVCKIKRLYTFDHVASYWNLQHQHCL